MSAVHLYALTMLVAATSAGWTAPPLETSASPQSLSGQAGAKPNSADLLASLYQDRRLCYASGSDPNERGASACERIGYRERALVRLGAEIPRRPFRNSIDPPEGEDVVSRYLRANPDDDRTPDEINQNILLLFYSAEQDRAVCHASSRQVEPACESLGFHERGLTMFGANLPR